MNMNLQKQTHSGWSEAEEKLLFDEVKAVRQTGKPLKSAFERVAELTGRQPNSIRNYYYVRIKSLDESDELFMGATAFVPFTESEVRELLKTILVNQAKGMSVRACTMMMGKNDTSKMLRYQNKYRAVIKNNPELVKSVLEELKAEGIEAHNPYALMKKTRQRASNVELLDAVSSAVAGLSNVEGLDVHAFFEALGALANSASRGAVALQRIAETEKNSDSDMAQTYDELRELRETVAVREAELSTQKERFALLLTLYRKLLNVNRSFLEKTSVLKVKVLGSYVKELAKSISDCDKALNEHVI